MAELVLRVVITAYFSKPALKNAKHPFPLTAFQSQSAVHPNHHFIYAGGSLTTLHGLSLAAWSKQNIRVRITALTDVALSHRAGLEEKNKKYNFNLIFDL